MKPSYPKRSVLFELMEKSLTTIFFCRNNKTIFDDQEDNK